MEYCLLTFNLKKLLTTTRVVWNGCDDVCFMCASLSAFSQSFLLTLHFVFILWQREKISSTAHTFVLAPFVCTHKCMSWQAIHSFFLTKIVWIKKEHLAPLQLLRSQNKPTQSSKQQWNARSNYAAKNRSWILKNHRESSRIIKRYVVLLRFRCWVVSCDVHSKGFISFQYSQETGKCIFTYILSKRWFVGSIPIKKRLEIGENIGTRF